MKAKCVITKIEPIMSMFSEEEKKWFCRETNVRTKYTFTFPAPEPGSEEEMEIDYARNQIVKNQFKLPMKYLQPDLGNTYMCQKSPNSKRTTDIRNASKIIEPLNIGFWDYIRLIPINQEIPIGTVYTLSASVPYSSNTRYFFMSNQLRCTTDRKGEIDFDPFIHIGTLDIGSEVNGKFTVQEVDRKIWDSYTYFKADDISESSFSIITYDFMKVDAVKVLEEILKICEERSKKYIEKWLEEAKKARGEKAKGK